MKSHESNAPEPLSVEELRLLKKVGNHIHKILHDKDQPVEWLAWESGTSRATIRRIFDADRNIGIITLDRVARALGYKDGVIGLFKDL